MELMNDDPRLRAAPRMAAMADTGPRVKAVRVEDDSMADAGVSSGDLVNLDPDLPALPGDVVLVIDSAGSYFLREYRQRTGGEFEAAARNMAYPSFLSSSHALRVVAVATHITKPLRRRAGSIGSSLLGIVGFLFASALIAASDLYLPQQDDEHTHAPSRALFAQAFA